MSGALRVAITHGGVSPRLRRPGRRPRLARTFARARWQEYRDLLSCAREEEYVAVGVEGLVAQDSPRTERRTLVLRHDVDQAPAAALTMAAIERDLGVTSSWYFRWRTAHPAVIEALRRDGFDVGLHYETRSRHALSSDVRAGLAGGGELARFRAELREEIGAFRDLHGEIASIAPHGDSRIPWASNAALMQGEDPRGYGIAFDANEAMRGRDLGYWLTDRSAADGGWKDGVDPAELFRQGITPILCLTHPNNWVSGPALWADRILSRLLPDAGARRRSPSRPIRSGSDEPPL